MISNALYCLRIRTNIVAVVWCLKKNSMQNDQSDQRTIFPAVPFEFLTRLSFHQHRATKFRAPNIPELTSHSCARRTADDSYWTSSIDCSSYSPTNYRCDSCSRCSICPWRPLAAVATGNQLSRCAAKLPVADQMARGRWSAARAEKSPAKEVEAMMAYRRQAAIPWSIELNNDLFPKMIIKWSWGPEPGLLKAGHWNPTKV